MGYCDLIYNQREKLLAWKPQTEVWPLVYGTNLASLLIAGSSFTVLIRMRQFFNLYTQQHFMGTILPTVGLPVAVFIIAHDLFIERRIFNGINKYKHVPFCSTCMEMRGSIIQASCAVVAPFILSISSCSASSITFRTFPVPGLNQIRKLFTTSARAGRTFSVTLMGLTFVNLAFGGWLTRQMIETQIWIDSAQIEPTVPSGEEKTSEIVTKSEK